MTFEEWYESIGQATGCSPRDLARAAFVAGRITMREELADHFAERVADRDIPNVTPVVRAAIQRDPHAALSALRRGVMRSVVQQIGSRDAGAS